MWNNYLEKHHRHEDRQDYIESDTSTEALSDIMEDDASKVPDKETVASSGNAENDDEEESGDEDNTEDSSDDEEADGEGDSDGDSDTDMPEESPVEEEDNSTPNVNLFSNIRQKENLLNLFEDLIADLASTIEKLNVRYRQLTSDRNKTAVDDKKSNKVDELDKNLSQHLGFIKQFEDLSNIIEDEKMSCHIAKSHETEIRLRLYSKRYKELVNSFIRTFKQKK